MFNRKLFPPSPYQIENNNLESSIDWGTVPVTLNHVCQRWKRVLKWGFFKKDRISQLSIDVTIMPAWQSLWSLPINEKGLLVTRKLCSTLSFLFHCAKWSFPCWLDDYYGQRWRLLPVSGQSMLMLEELFPPPTRKRWARSDRVFCDIFISFLSFAAWVT